MEAHAGVTENSPGAIKANLGVMEINTEITAGAHYEVVEANPRVIEANLGIMEAYHGVMEAHGVMVAYHGVMEAYLGVMEINTEITAGAHY
jgi:hypothetical protein